VNVAFVVAVAATAFAINASAAMPSGAAPPVSTPTAGAAPAAAPAPAPGSQMMLTSTAFEDGGVLPPKHAGGATALSPALNWSDTPSSVQSFVVLMHDMEPAPNKTSKMDITHWLAWNIPGTSSGLPEGVPAGALSDGTQQISIRSNGYFGSGAGPGKYHHYVFELYALDTRLTVASADQSKAAPTDQLTQAMTIRRAVFDAMDGHVLAKAVLVSRFHR
jgi:Raf kinase inhibitor-like YbhB/YbcL family protein